jgi:hypothetical protein
MKAQLVPSSGNLVELEARIRLITGWWRDLYDGGDPGAATWEDLDRLQQEVTECLDRRSLNVGKADSLTARACFLITGCSDP